MSWPVVKSPWANIKWLTWGNQLHSPWVSPPMITVSTDNTVMDTSGELYSLKQIIEDLDSSNQWEFLKRTSNPYELVYSQSQDMRIPKSICSLRPLSRSFFKMVEILSVMDFFKRNQESKQKRVLQSAHICEGPGGFIEALVNLSEKNNFTLQNAWTMTLKPTKANIPGWKRAYNFLRNSPMVHIEYGDDETGDVLVPVNQASFLERTRGKCNIFTADGGFDFSEHYGNQEQEVYPLLISSGLIGLQTLAKGGDFVLKVFDTELQSTRDLLAILAYCFDHWTLYKPSLSRPCNAEKYFLGRGRRSIPPWILNVLTGIRDFYIKPTNHGKHISGIFPLIPETIKSDLMNLKKEYAEQQVESVKYAISHKEEWNKNPSKIWNAIHDNSLQWCRQFQMPVKPFTFPLNQPAEIRRNREDADQP